MILTALALFLAPLLPAQELGEGEQVDFDGILAQARERYGLESADLLSLKVTGLLDGPQFLRAELGPFDLRLPVHEAAAKNGASPMREAATTMLDTLSVWAQWTRVEEAEVEAIEDDLSVLRKWIKGWSSRALKKASDAEGETLLERMSAGDNVRAASKRLQEAMSPDFDTEVPGQPARIVLAPTRETFAELVTLFGAIEPERKSVLWENKSVFYSAGWTKEWQVVALEYPSWPWDAAHPFLGDSMNVLHKNGRRQHVVDRASASLLRAVFDAIATPLVEQALRTNLVIAVVGEERPTSGTWSFQWSRAGGSTAPYSRFVPGGNSAGGTLPPRKATGGPKGSSGEGTEESAYRAGNGEDHFAKPLKKGQKRGAKLARGVDLPSLLKRDKTAHFAVGIVGKSEATVVSAPFLGELAEDKPVPAAEFVDEYEEFFRAYRAGFLHWLQTEGHPEGKKSSPAAFARLLDRLRRRTAGDTLSSMVEEVYGLALSSADGTTDSLEWRFLTRVAK